MPERCRALAAAARASIAALTGMTPLSPDDPAWYAQMVSVPLDDGEGAQRRLREDFGIEAPVIAWRDRRLLRLSFQGYNDGRDLEAVVAAVSHLLESLPAPP